MHLKKTIRILYLVVGALTALEFIFVRGMFTWLIAVAATVVVGLIAVFLSARDKEWLTSLLYVLCTVALCMGYFAIAGV